jgi:hypothetical protein
VKKLALLSLALLALAGAVLGAARSGGASTRGGAIQVVAARVTDATRERGTPVATIAETLAPANASLQDWQARQLEALETALVRATGR